MKIYLSLLIAVIGLSCARSPIKTPSQALRQTAWPKEIARSLYSDTALLSLAIQANIKRLEEVPKQELRFGAEYVSKAAYISALRKLDKAMDEPETNILDYLQSNFELFEVYGQSEWSEVLVTSYFAPQINGSFKKTKKYSKPLDGFPEDMSVVVFNDFIKAYPNLIEDPKLKDKLISKNLRLRARTAPHYKYQSEVKPYASRSELHTQKPKAPILAWVDPIDGFFLEIQGSGTILMDGKKELRLGYAEQNGHKYEAIGKYLFDVIPREEMSLQRIEEHLRSLSTDEAQNILNKNPSYVFFRQLEGEPVTSFGSEAVPGHTIATDRKYFPKGAMGILQFPKPQFKPNGTLWEVETWPIESRLVLDQDTGGAIKGPGRVDLYWGKGAEAKKYSGPMKNSGRLYYLVPKIQR